jgi:hypothetical protein
VGKWVTRHLVMVGLLALALVTSSANSAVALVAPEGPRLAVAKNTLFPFRYDLETVDETGAQPLWLAGGGPKERPLPEFASPSWSPDGSLIVFSALSGKIDQGCGAVRLYVISADGSGLRALKETHGGDEPKFSSDGHTVFFTRYWSRRPVGDDGRKGAVRSGSSIWAVDMFGGAPRRVTVNRDAVWMFAGSVSPNGEDLLASRSFRRGPWCVVQIDLATGTSSLFLRRAAGPVYSPDGSRVAVVRWRNVNHHGEKAESRSDLLTVDRDGGRLRRVASSLGRIQIEEVDSQDAAALGAWAESVCQGWTVSDLAAILKVEPTIDGILAYLSRGLDGDAKQAVIDGCMRRLDFDPQSGAK